MNKRVALLIPVAVLALSGCIGGLGSGDYERTETRRAYEVKMGVVESVRSVMIEGTQSGVGTATGAVVGGVVGSEVGGGKGKTLATVIGAVAGGIAGSAAEKGLTKKPGLEITVRMDTGRTFAVIQEDTGERFNVGERVRILESGGQMRVSH